ncbi:MAG: hypothetical protein ACKVT2_20460 [Saprospiraceae bacterium]
MWQGINKNERDRGANLISQEAYSIEENRINKAVLTLIDELPYDFFENHTEILPAPGSPRNQGHTPAGISEKRRGERMNQSAGMNQDFLDFYKDLARCWLSWLPAKSL